MHFKQPEILYFLFALVVPILVHLFQLRRFKIAYFTNVRFLKDISIQTRKSAKIKKWLLLATRLLLFTCLILAFAQPYFSSEKNNSKQAETYIILDNSFSMQAKGKQGELLKRSVEELLTHLPENLEFSLITANETFWNVTVKSIRKDLQRLNYSPISFELDRSLAQLNARPARDKKNILVVTDGLQLQSKLLEKNAESNRLWVVTPKAEQKNNTAIDSAYVLNHSNDFYTLAVRLTPYGSQASAIPLALYAQDKVVAKTIVELKASPKTVTFTLPKKSFNGCLRISDQSLTYDNSLYISISKPKIIPVLCLGDPAKSDFLRRIYTPDEFQFSNQALNQLDYNSIEQQDVIICNELLAIPAALQSSLKAFANQGGTLIVIPSAQATATPDYVALLNQFGKFAVEEQPASAQLITQIAFAHPVYKSAFEKSISNFDYPKTNSNYRIKSAAIPLLSYANQQPFLLSAPLANSNLYVFTGAINNQNSNFQQSPLIVPTFYNLAALQQPIRQTYATIGKANNLIVEAKLAKEALLSLQNESGSFIPQQQNLGQKVKLNCADNPATAGNYGLVKDKQTIDTLSFNYARNESDLQANRFSFSLSQEASSIESVLDDWKSSQTDSNVWKWFVLLSLLFVILEVLIQKFVS